jgi:hypothetical protein
MIHRVQAETDHIKFAFLWERKGKVHGEFVTQDNELRYIRPEIFVFADRMYGHCLSDLSPGIIETTEKTTIENLNDNHSINVGVGDALEEGTRCRLIALRSAGGDD